MTIEEKKQYLKSYRNEYNKWMSLEDQKKSIIADAVSAKAQSYSDMPKGCHKTDISDIMVRLEDVMKQIDNKMAECIAIKVKIESAIINMKDGNESIVLRDRYINFSSWKKISERLNYTERQIFKFHGHALQNIVL